MKLIFRGHDDRYAIEQSLLAFFPEERPVYETAEAGEDDCAYVSLTEGKRYATGVTSIHYHGKTARGVSRAVLTDAPDEYERERLRQRALKLSFFKAARDITGVTPSWGALTGIRPGKLARAMLEQGKTERETDRVLRDTYFVSPERRRLAIETARAGLKAKRDLRPDEISLYVGIPFCPTRCAYCSFVSASVEKSFGLMEPYLASLEQEITDAARMVAETGLRIKSFYFAILAAAAGDRTRKDTLTVSFHTFLPSEAFGWADYRQSRRAAGRRPPAFVRAALFFPEILLYNSPEKRAPLTSVYAIDSGEGPL